MTESFPLAANDNESLELMQVREYLEEQCAYADAIYGEVQDWMVSEDPRPALKELLTAFDRMDYKIVEEGLEKIRAKIRTYAEEQLKPGEHSDSGLTRENMSAYLERLDIMISLLPGSSEKM